MSNTISEAIETDEIPTVNSIAAEDLIIVTANVSGNAQTRNITSENLFGNSAHTVKAANLFIEFHGSPANSTALTVRVGACWGDNDYWYVATANNFVKRSALVSF